MKKIRSKKISNLYLNPIKNKLEILSPSDFGFHNSLKTKKDQIIFFDFEYFGKDDPVKLAADFLLHPGMTLNLQQKKIQDSELPEKTMEIMSLYKHTNINLYSYYKNLNTPSNVKLLKWKK